MRRRQVEPRKFASGDGRPIATLRLEPDELRERYGLEFRTDVAEGLGQYRFAVFELTGGQPIWLIRYKHAPGPGTEVIADSRADAAKCLTALLREFDLNESDLAWHAESSRE